MSLPLIGSGRAILPRQSSLATGLAIYYGFEDGSGSSVSDASGQGNTGTWNGTLGSQWGTGLRGGGGVFDGSTNYVTSPKATILNSATFTLAFWLKAATVTPSQLLILGMKLYTDAGASAGTGWQCYLNTTGTFTFTFVGGTATTTTTATLPDTGWHRLLVLASGSPQFYLDGALMAETITAGVGATNTERISFGAYNTNASPTRDWHGSLDEIAYWTRLLDLDEIAADYNHGSGFRPV